MSHGRKAPAVGRRQSGKRGLSQFLNSDDLISCFTPAPPEPIQMLGRREMQVSHAAVPSRWFLIVLVAAGVLLLRLATVASAQAAECTNTWTGPAEGSWLTAGNWSTGHAPTNAEVACVGSGKTVTIGSGANHAAVIQSEGTIVLSGGSIELSGTASSSALTSLTISGGVLKGPGTLTVTGFLSWSGAAELAGSGSFIVASGAEGSYSATGGSSFVTRQFVNEGSFTVSSGFLRLLSGSNITNDGTFTLNSEHTPQPPLETGITGAFARFANHGLLRKTAGTGESRIDVEVENNNTVEAQTGKLVFELGGSSESPGTWKAAEAAKLVFQTGGAFFRGSTLAGSILVKTVSTLKNVDGESAHLTFEASGGVGMTAEGTSTVASFKLLGGTQKGPGTLNILNNFWWEGANNGFAGKGSTVVLPSAEASIAPSTAVGLGERRFVNRGKATLSSGWIAMSGGAEFVNEGTFTANSEHAPAISVESGSAKFVNDSVLQKTAGAGTTEIVPEFENFGKINEASGKLKFPNQIKLKASTATPHHSCAGDPVDCATGNFTETQTDFEIGGRGVGLDLIRTYSAQAAKAEALGIFGYGWTNSFGDKLTAEESGGKQTLTDSMAGTVTFTKSGAAYLAPSWSRDTLSGSAEAGFTLTLPDQTKEKFSGSGRLESVTDRNGNETVLAYNGSGKLETISDPAGRKITLTYNAEGLVEKAKDPVGHEVKYAYEGKALKSVTLPGEASPNSQFKYDASRRMTTMTDGRGGKTANEFDSSSRVIAQTDPAERKTTWEYNPFHTKITNKATGAVTDEWFNSNNQPVSITHGFGTAAATTETFGYTDGFLASRTDGNGHTWSYGYDGNGNRTSEVDPLEHETKWTYNGAHQVLSETEPSGEKTTITRDANGNPETSSRPAPKSETQTVSYEYGPDDELESMTDPLGDVWSYEYDSHGDLKAEIDPEGDRRSWGYDEDSRLTSAVSPRGNEEGAEAAKFTTSIERDAQSRPLKITDPLEGTTKYAYDADGDVESITDPNGRKTKFTYDADNERTKIERPSGAVEETGYDGAGQVTSQTDGNKDKTTYIRNVLEQPIEVIDPLERKTTEIFDAAGNLKTKKDPDGRTTTFSYDNANRLKEISYSDGITPKAIFSYDKNGNLTSMVDGTGESSFEYDQLDRLTHSKDGNGGTVSWEYNRGNEPIGLTYPNGKSISRAYDKAGRLENVTDWLGNTTSFAYNKDSELSKTIFPSGAGNLDEYAFDRAERMSSVTMKKGAETLASLSYARDKVGQVESLISKGLPGAEEESFGYDENERLKTAGAGSYEYDSANNLTKAPGTANAFDKASQLESASGATFSYDKEGERTKLTPSGGSATTYKYDQAGNLTAVERVEEGEAPAIAEAFAYDGAGLLTSRTLGLSTRQFVWDLNEGLPLVLSDGDNSYLYGPGGLAVEQISGGEAPTYLHHDQLGSTRVLTNSAGEVVGTATYKPYGAVSGRTGAASSPLDFAGQYTMGESGLIYLRARFYDPNTAQFMNRDPLVGLTRAPYVYGMDNPINLHDRSGRAAESAEGGCPSPVCFPFPTWGEAESAGAGLGELGGEIASGVSGAFSSVFGGEDEEEASSAESADTPRSCEEELQDEVATEIGKEIGDARQAFTRAAEFMEQVGIAAGSNPNSPSGGSRWVRVLALLAKILHR